jgi:hypothetical protein
MTTVTWAVLGKDTSIERSSHTLIVTEQDVAPITHMHLIGGTTRKAKSKSDRNINILKIQCAETGNQGMQA